MKKRFLVTVSVVQVLILGALMLALWPQSNQTALQYSRMAELSANAYAAELVLNHRNDVQKQFSFEREDMKQYVEATVSRRINQLQINQH